MLFWQRVKGSRLLVLGRGMRRRLLLRRLVLEVQVLLVLLVLRRSPGLRLHLLRELGREYRLLLDLRVLQLRPVVGLLLLLLQRGSVSLLGVCLGLRLWLLLYER